MYPTLHPATTSSGQVFVMAPLFKLCLPALFLAMAVPVQAEEKVVNLYSWADYVAPETLQRFEQETVRRHRSADQRSGQWQCLPGVDLQR
jgi:putrescine transport system substrate-binding protein